MTFSKIILSIGIVTMISSCNKKDAVDSRRESFFLQDSLFRIVIDVPSELDSFYAWVDRSDVSCAHIRKYRFSDSKYPILKETGFFKPTYPDSSYRLTLSHINNFDCQNVIKKVDLNGMIKGFEARAQIDSIEFHLISSEAIEINGLSFAIMTFRTIWSTPTYESTVVWGFTKVDTINLEVQYECARNNCDGFVERMTESFRSIKVLKKG